eukprot:scaffold11816_cov129-Isochrysis_galbana.AAC.1
MSTRSDLRQRFGFGWVRTARRFPAGARLSHLRKTDTWERAGIRNRQNASSRSNCMVCRAGLAS